MIEILRKNKAWVRDGEVVHSRVFLKKNGRVLYYSKDAVHMNIGDNDDPKFFKFSVDKECVLLLESDQHVRVDNYILVDLEEELGYRLGYFQDKESLELLRRFESITREDIILFFKNRGVNSEELRSDNFRFGFLDIIGVNPWVKEELGSVS